MKSFYPTVRVVVGRVVYYVDCQVLPPRAPARVGADSPRFLDPGSPPRVQVRRILRDQVDVTEDLNYWTKRPVVEAAEKEALARFSRNLILLRQLRKRVRQAAGRTA